MSKAKYIKKSKLKFKNGNLVTKKGKIVFVEPRVIDEFNMLEEMVQKQNWMIKAIAQSGIPIEPYKFESARAIELEDDFIEVDTSTLDKQIKESLEVAKEIDNVTAKEKVKDYLENKFADLLKFVREDEIIVYEGKIYSEFDLKCIGNPLMINEAAVIDIIWECIKTAMDFSSNYDHKYVNNE